MENNQTAIDINGKNKEPAAEVENEGYGVDSKYDLEECVLKAADILCVKKEAIISDCKRHILNKITGILTEAIVGASFSGNAAKTIEKAITFGIRSVAISPCFIDEAEKAIAKKGEVKVCAVVDFPFGESTFKSKYAEMKSAVKRGVDGTLTVFPIALTAKENHKELKKQLKKTGKLRTETGVAISMENATDDAVKQFIRSADKSGVSYIGFLFGQSSEKEIEEKLAVITSEKSKKPIAVYAGVSEEAGLKKLYGAGVNAVISPYSSELAEKLFKDYKVKV